MRRGTGWLLLAAVTLFFTVSIWAMCVLPAQALPDPCVNWSEICVPGYVVKWLPAEPAVDPAPVSVSGVERWRPLVEYFWPSWAVDRMLRIMNCESGGDPNAYNGSTGVRGLFQVHPLWQAVWPGDYYDPWTNASVAYQVWLEQGFGAWVCTG